MVAQGVIAPDWTIVEYTRRSGRQLDCASHDPKYASKVFCTAGGTSVSRQLASIFPS